MAQQDTRTNYCWYQQNELRTAQNPAQHRVLEKQTNAPSSYMNEQEQRLALAKNVAMYLAKYA